MSTSLDESDLRKADLDLIMASTCIISLVILMYFKWRFYRKSVPLDLKLFSLLPHFKP